MKHIILIISSFLSSICMAQVSPLYLFIEDNIGRRDTVEFGLKNDATLGIDALLGEKNIYDTQFDSLEIRVIQRDAANYYCLKLPFSDNPIYSTYNIDSKIDYRNMLGGAPFSSINCNFQFLVKGYEYPIKVYGNFANICGSGFFPSTIALYDVNCAEISNSGLRCSSSTNLIFNINSSNVNTIVVHFELETGTHDLRNEPPLWNLFPNPGKEKLIINEIPYRNSSLQIFNLLGELLYSIDLSGNQFSLDIGFIPQGSYIIRLIDTKNKVYSSKNFIKLN